MNAVVEWAELPPARKTSRVGRQVDWMAVTALLRTSPGRWARVEIPLSENAARQLAHSICRRPWQRRAFASGEFEAASRGSHLYVRYIGQRAR